MARYRKKPVIIEAHQWFKNGDHPADRVESIDIGSDIIQTEGKVVRRFRDPDVDGDKKCARCAKPFHLHGWIDTLEGGHSVCPSDYIITGVRGERYPCKADIFEETYEKV